MLWPPPEEPPCWPCTPNLHEAFLRCMGVSMFCLLIK